MEKEVMYVAPTVKIIEVEVEMGFAISDGVTSEGDGGGDNPF